MIVSARETEKMKKMAEYEVTGYWVHEETRAVKARNQKEAIQKVMDGDYDRIIDWRLVDQCYEGSWSARIARKKRVSKRK